MTDEVFGDDELHEGELVGEFASRRELVVQRVQALVPAAKTAAVATVGVAAGAITAAAVVKVAQSQQKRLPKRRKDDETRLVVESTTALLVEIHQLRRAA
jgi:hypothetical protein